MKVRTLHYLVKEGARGIRRHRSLTLTAVATMTASLLVLGVFMIASFNVRRVVGDLENRKQVAVYLKDGTGEEARFAVEKRLALHPAVERFVFIPRDEAWEEFTATMDDEGLLEAVGENPLPDAYRLHLRAEQRDAAAINGLALEVGAWDEVEEVVTGGSWVGSFDRFARGVLLVTAAIGLAVALSIVAIISNTVRLTVVARRDLIEIMKSVGASEGFIRVPFVSEGLIQALLAGVLALAALFGVTLLVERRLDGVEFVSLAWCAAFLGFALVMGLTGSVISVRHVLRQVGL